MTAVTASQARTHLVVARPASVSAGFPPFGVSLMLSVWSRTTSMSGGSQLPPSPMGLVLSPNMGASIPPESVVDPSGPFGELSPPQAPRTPDSTKVEKTIRVRKVSLRVLLPE